MAIGPTYYRDRLAEVNAAITKAEKRQSYAIEGRSMSAARLEELYGERRRLEPLAAREAQQESAGAVSTVRFSTSKGL